MNIKEFEQWVDKKNNKEIKKHWTYAEDIIYVDYREWKHKITFLDKFVKVLWDYWCWDCFVDEVIWFINDTETTYINEEFLDICIKYKIFWEKARDFYHKNLDENMDRWEWEFISYEQTLNGS